VFADGEYAGKLVDWAKQKADLVLSIVRRPRALPRFEPLPRRWVIERTFGWPIKNRRLVRDFEQRTDVAETLIRVSAKRLLSLDAFNSSELGTRCRSGPSTSSPLMNRRLTLELLRRGCRASSGAPFPPSSTSSGPTCSPCSRSSLESGACAPTKLDPLSNAAKRQRDVKGCTDMSIGTVKWFNATKGYGFIQPHDGSKDVFLHISDIERAGMENPKEGQKLEYGLQQGQQGKVSAGNLKLA